MTNDTISRSALAAELENFKVTAGDPVIRLIIDRVIGIVNAQPGVDAAPMGSCDKCKHAEVDVDAEPCLSCIEKMGLCRPNWEPCHENL